MDDYGLFRAQGIATRDSYQVFKLCFVFDSLWQFSGGILSPTLEQVKRKKTVAAWLIAAVIAPLCSKDRGSHRPRQTSNSRRLETLAEATSVFGAGLLRTPLGVLKIFENVEVDSGDAFSQSSLVTLGQLFQFFGWSKLYTVFSCHGVVWRAFILLIPDGIGF